jgi:hypothetical protein
MKKKIISLCVSLLALLPVPTFSQGSGEAYHPETANGANNIHSIGHRLLWENPDSTIYNKIYFSSDSILVAQMNASVLLYDGFPNIVYDSIYLNLVEPLEWNTKYFWRVVEDYQSGLIEGTVWYFRTMSYPLCDYEEFFDDFENGPGNWTVTNNGGDCVWEIFFPPYPNAYLMPSTSTGGLLSADSDECGTGTSVRTTITLNESFGGGYGYKSLEFDNDWNVLDSTDIAYIEVSTNGGENWEIIWSKIGEDLRMTHEIVPIIQGGEILLRFRVIQPDWNWWWAIDNVKLVQDCPLTQFYPPHNLKLNTVTQQPTRVDLSWERIGPWYQPHFYIFRKLGLPSDPTSYSFVGMVSYTMTTFSDTSVIIDNNYTYQINNGPYPNGFSNEATAYIPDIPTSSSSEITFLSEFYLEQNYPNPFNPITKIKYSIPSVETHRDASLQVKMTVFDILGNEVAGLVNDNKHSGTYEVEFNGTNLPSGIYFYQLKTGSFIETKKMILLK